jgi:hypothetical protein
MRLGLAAAGIAVAAACLTGAATTAAGIPEPDHESLADFLGLIARRHYDAVLMFGLYYGPHFAPDARRYPKVPFVLTSASRGGVPMGRPTSRGR